MKFILPSWEIEKLLASSQLAFPREACGLILRQDFKRFSVLSLRATRHEDNTPVSFRIRDATIAEISDSLKGSTTTMAGCFHSHVAGAARPSKVDCAAAKRAGDLWLIYSMRFRRLNLFGWDGGAFQQCRFLIASDASTKFSAI